jgi:hypothetical protein
MVCRSLDETRAYTPEHFRLFSSLAKNLSDFTFREARFRGILRCHLIMAAEDPFRPPVGVPGGGWSLLMRVSDLKRWKARAEFTNKPQLF